MNLPGEISIGRAYGGDETRPIRIEIEDKQSGIIVAEVWLTLKDFAEALMGRGCVACEVEYGRLDLVGKVRQWKEELIPEPADDHCFWGEEEFKAYLAKWEVDGWMADWRDMRNSHRHSYKDNAHRVGFVRFVDAEAQNSELAS